MSFVYFCVFHVKREEFVAAVEYIEKIAFALLVLLSLDCRLGWRIS